jgi:hypothetical protein
MHCVVAPCRSTPQVAQVTTQGPPGGQSYTLLSTQTLGGLAREVIDDDNITEVAMIT